MLKRLKTLALIGGCLLTWQAQAAVLQVGVLAEYPHRDAEAHWAPVHAYLDAALPEYEVQLRIVRHLELENLVRQSQIDLLLTDPAHAVLLQHQRGLSAPLATLNIQHQGQPLDRQAGVIVSRGSSSVHTLADLQGRQVAAVSRSSLTGYLAQLYQLHEAGIDPNRIHFEFANITHEQVVDAVVSGQVDAGFLRAGVMESLQQGGALEANALRVVAPVAVVNYPYATSTPLYPHWPLVALPHLDNHTLRSLTASLLGYGLNGDAGSADWLAGFSVPANYASVELLLRELGVAPFESAQPQGLDLSGLWAEFQWVLLSVVALLLFLLLVLFASIRSSRKAVLAGERFNQLYNNSPEPMLIMEEEQFIDCNEAAYRLVGYESRESLIGLTPVDLSPPQQPDGLSSADKSALFLQRLSRQGFSGGMEKTEWVFEHKGGRLLTVEVTMMPFSMKEQSVILVVWHDLTDRKEAEKELLRQKTALQESNAELEQFAYVASHDLRQPLRMISSYLQLLDKKHSERMDEESRQMMRYARQGAKRLDQMLVSLLDYSRVGRKSEARSMTSSRQAIDEALKFLQPAIEDREAQIRIQPFDWPKVFASPDELTRLFQNLISNGIKYCIPGTRPSVELSVEQEGRQWKFCVADEGIGIDPEQADRLFRMFQRLQTRTKYEGYGVGLAVCRKIVEQHGGSIWVESKGENQGSRFYFTLPVHIDMSPDYR